MTPSVSTSAGRKRIAFWDNRDFLGRLELILKNHQVFRSFGLVSDSEIRLAESLTLSAKEYIVEREDQPIFTTIALKQEMGKQRCSKRLKAALNHLSVGCF